MYVLVDIEWANNANNEHSITQLAAEKVDEHWNTVCAYDTLIRPANKSFEDWQQVCYIGSRIKHFLTAPPLSSALKDFEAWLAEEDVLLFWFSESQSLYNTVRKEVLSEAAHRKTIVLGEYLPALLKKKNAYRKNPYVLLKKAGTECTLQQHKATNDVHAMREALKTIQMPQSMLLTLPPHFKPEPRVYPYVYDKTNRILHRNRCPEIRDQNNLMGLDTLQSGVKKDLTPCRTCLKAEFHSARKQRNLDILSRAKYNYVYIETSEVFHKPTCHLIHSTKNTIFGTVRYDSICHYDSAINMKRRPCKVCQPVPEDEHPLISKPVPKEPEVCRNLTASEERALRKHKCMTEERERALKRKQMSIQEKTDMYVLTQPEFSFWAGRGYSTFHLRNCPKLRGVENLVGFKYYGQAEHSGYHPCKQCKPSRKHDTKLSIPLDNRIREGESIEVLAQSCEDAGYRYEVNTAQFIISTPVGEWKIHTQSAPFMVEHKNIAKGDSTYHQQHRMFLSLYDAFRYIHRHDTQLEEKTQTNEWKFSDMMEKWRVKFAEKI